MKAIVSVIGRDKVGIIKEVSTVLADNNVNILDISQTIMQDMFTMIMSVEISRLEVDFKELDKKLSELGKRLGLSIIIQHEDIFNSMHRI